MPKLTFNITTSLDGFITGPNPGLEHPLGEGGERLHEWGTKLESWRSRHGLEGGVSNPNNEVLEEQWNAAGAILMGKRMFAGHDGPWGEEPAQGWWGDEPPFGVPVFVLTHHPREPLIKGDTTFTFVTDGAESALEQARAAAGERDVLIAGGANVFQQYLKAGLIDEFQLSVAPVLVGEGVRLFDALGTDSIELEGTRVVSTPEVTHLKYVVKN